MKKNVEINGKEYLIETFPENNGNYSAMYQFDQKGSTIPLISPALDESMSRILDTNEQRLIERVVVQIRNDTSPR